MAIPMARKNLWETLYREAEESASRETITVKSPRLRIQKSPERQYTRINHAIIDSWTRKCKTISISPERPFLPHHVGTDRPPLGVIVVTQQGGGQLVEGLQPSRDRRSVTNHMRNLLI